MIEVRGIDMNGDPRVVAAEVSSAEDLTSVILNTRWKYAQLSQSGRVIAEVTLCPCTGGTPTRQVKLHTPS